MTAGEVELEPLLRFLYLCPVAAIQMRRDGSIELINPVAAALLMPIAVAGALTNLCALLEPFAPGLGDAIAGFAPESGTIIEQRQATLPGPRGEPTIIAITVFAIDRSRCAAVLGDVTRVVAQERRLFVQDQRLRAIVESVKEYALFTADRQGRIDEWNRSLARFVDGDDASVMGRPLGALFDASPVEIDTARLIAEATSSGGVKVEGWLRTADPRTRWAEAMVSPLLAVDGEATGFGVVLHDTTERRDYEQRLVRLATTDPLTGLLNRRAFFDVAERELSRAVRYGRPLALLMIDVDHFKAVNDTHGHDVGDQVLIALADACRKSVRDVDVVARLGGEEFAILAPETELARGGVLAERLRGVATGLVVPTPKGALRITVSIGVAERGAAPGETCAAILKRADTGLYAAKAGGRDRVVLDG